MFGKPLATLFTVAAAALSVSALTIDTPKNLTQCNTVTLTWHGKKAPFVLAVLPSCDSGIDEPLLELAPMNVTTYKWTVNVPPKTGSIAFAITDVEGNEAYTDEVEIGTSNVTCLSSASSNAPSSVAPTSTKAAATSASVRTTLVVATTSAASAPSKPVNVGGNSGGSSSGSGGGNASAASTNVNGAITNTASVFASMICVATGFLVLL
ncbi:hypothetical protein FRC10_007611 [Ceratobasidium sp. 414]|nr:hypothetical protein FRC10_007611 [Ceratobasidium sp. 414]